MASAWLLGAIYFDSRLYMAQLFEKKKEYGYGISVTGYICYLRVVKRNQRERALLYW